MVSYQWDANGNLLDDGENSYAYNTANRLRVVSGESSVASYAYNGLGDRVRQTVDDETTTYTLDLASGLTQVLNDGTNDYIYGLGRIAQVDTGAEYFLGDALGSVRQLVDENGLVTLAQSYMPYGETIGTSHTALGKGEGLEWLGEFRGLTMGWQFVYNDWEIPVMGFPRNQRRNERMKK